jgi:Resolvase, N terminal domain
MESRRYITYFRVSTTRQGRSGLGLEAQQQALDIFLHGHGELIVESFTEIESGRRNDRPQLAAALDACRRHKAVLLIAKLDRLARNVHFINGLMESGVEFIAVDMPEANRLTIHIFAARVLPVIRGLQAKGVTSHKTLAKALNARGVVTANKRKWYGTTVKNLLARPSTH